jgi:hypothetical protein
MASINMPQENRGIEKLASLIGVVKGVKDLATTSPEEEAKQIALADAKEKRDANSPASQSSRKGVEAFTGIKLPDTVTAAQIDTDPTIKAQLDVKIKQLSESVKKNEVAPEEYVQKLSQGYLKEAAEGAPGAVRLYVKGEDKPRYAVPGEPLASMFGEQLKTTQLMLNQAELAKRQKEAAKEAQGGQFKKEQYDAAGFADRLVKSENILNSLEAKGFQQGSLSTAAQGALPAILEPLKSEDVKKYENAKKNFITATLRRESGAAISPAEFKEQAAIYFPQAGDTPDVIAEKASNRASKLAEFQAAAGGALGEVLGQKPLENKATRADPNISKYAEQYKLDYKTAETILRNRGYGK